MIERLVPAGQGWTVRVRCSDRSDGDFRCDSADRSPEGSRLGADARGGAAVRSDAEAGKTRLGDAEAGTTRLGGGGDDAILERRRQALMDGHWTWLRQVHGAEVVVVTEPGAHAGAAADGAVTTVPRAVLAVNTADCAPVVVTGGGALGVAHAGWRGIAAGIIGEVVEAVRLAAPDPFPRLLALLGPVIRPAHYEFSASTLAAVEAVAGCDVRAVTDWGTPALDLAAAVRGALGAAGVSRVVDLGLDTAQQCYFSYRVGGDTARQAMAARLEPIP